MQANARKSSIADRLRATMILAGFMGLTLPLMPVQWVLLKTSPRWARTFPHWYHRRVCRLLGIRIHIDGEVVRNEPVLIVSNHVSWLDIPVLSAVAPVSFVAKSEVSKWPFVSWLAKLQRTVFVDRTRRSDVGRVTNAMADRLAGGDTLILFAEGTSTDGNRVLAFRSALLSPAFGPTSQGPTSQGPTSQGPTSQGPASNVATSNGPASKPDQQEHARAPVVQTLSVVYTHLHGIPLGRSDRNLIGWYGDMGMADHAWGLLQAGPIDVHVTISKPIALSSYQDRKHLAQAAELAVRNGVVRALRGKTADEAQATEVTR